jgi:hypothetical protein
MKNCFKLVEVTSSENSIIGVIHVHRIKSDILCAGIKKATKRYWEGYGAHWLNSYSTKTIEWF